ncbi:MAG: AN1-type zinc finger domain-containing protein, partial [Candidatus Bathyarchaeia archaeon]
MVKCRVCGAELYMPFLCTYCGKYFCANHRIPENHFCEKIRLVRAQLHLPERESISYRLRYNVFNRMDKALKFRSRIVGTTEIQQLLIAWLVLGFCFSASSIFNPSLFPTMFAVSLLTVGSGFIFHELTHKFVAQRYGCWAEFRLWTLGLVLAVFFAILSRGTFIFAAPGAVYIVPAISPLGRPIITKRENGLISVSGSLMNLLLAVIFFPLKYFEGILGIIGYLGSRVNILMASFNLIPIGPFDGYKVFSWNPIVWATVTIPAWASLF